MPYGVHSDENFDISMAKDILDEGHYEWKMSNKEF